MAYPPQLARTTLATYFWAIIINNTPTKSVQIQRSEIDLGTIFKNPIFAPYQLYSNVSFKMEQIQDVDTTAEITTGRNPKIAAPTNQLPRHAVGVVSSASLLSHWGTTRGGRGKVRRGRWQGSEVGEFIHTLCTACATQVHWHKHWAVPPSQRPPRFTTCCSQPRRCQRPGRNPGW